MIDLLKKTMLTGLGLAVMTKERLDELRDELIKKGQMSEQEGKEFVDELMRKSEQAEKEFQERVERTVQSVVERLNLATHDDIAALDAKLTALLQRQNQQPPAPPA